MTRMPEALEAPLRGPAHRAEADDAGGPPGDLPGAVALVGDGAVVEDRAGAHVAVAGDDVAGDGEEQGDGHLGDAVGVAARGVQHRDALVGGAGDVDVGGVAPGRADGPQRQVEHRARAESASQIDDVGATSAMRAASCSAP